MSKWGAAALAAAQPAPRPAPHGTAPTAESQPCNGVHTAGKVHADRLTVHASKSVHACSWKRERAMHAGEDLKAPCSGGKSSGTSRHAARPRLTQCSNGSPEAAATVSSFIAGG